MNRQKIVKSKWYAIKWENNTFMAGFKRITVLALPGQKTERATNALMLELDERGNHCRKPQYRGVPGKYHYSVWRGSRILALMEKAPHAVVVFETELTESERSNG